MRRRIFAVLLAGCLTTAQAAEKGVTTVEGFTVQGSDEQPKVMYLVPWQPPTLSKRAPPPLRDQMDDLLMPLDPEPAEDHSAFRRELKVPVAPVGKLKGNP